MLAQTGVILAAVIGADTEPRRRRTGWWEGAPIQNHDAPHRMGGHGKTHRKPRTRQHGRTGPAPPAEDGRQRSGADAGAQPPRPPAPATPQTPTADPRPEPAADPGPVDRDTGGAGRADAGGKPPSPARPAAPHAGRPPRDDAGGDGDPDAGPDRRSSFPIAASISTRAPSRAARCSSPGRIAARRNSSPVCIFTPSAAALMTVHHPRGSRPRRSRDARPGSRPPGALFRPASGLRRPRAVAENHPTPQPAGSPRASNPRDIAACPRALTESPWAHAARPSGGT